MTTRTALALLAGLALLTPACSQEEKTYPPKPAYSGKKANLPPVPALPNKSKKEGDAYTVWAATHDLRSDVHRHDFDGKEISLVGYIVKTNYDAACADEKKPGETEDPCVPKCAIHKQGKADTDDCNAPYPGFWIAEHA